MRRPRFTIARWMAATAVLAVNIALLRAFLVSEMFHGVILIFVALQVGLGFSLRCRGRARRFWLGFELSGVAAVLAMLVLDIFPDSAPAGLMNGYVSFVFNSSVTYLPTILDDSLMEHQDGVLVVLYFLPEFLAALVGGLIASRAVGIKREDADHEMRQIPASDLDPSS